MYLFILEYLFESRPFDVFDYAFRSLEKLFNQTGLSVFVDRFFPVCGTYGNQNIQSAEYFRILIPKIAYCPLHILLTD